MKRSELFFYVTNGSAGLRGDGTRGDAEIIAAGSHTARLEWARSYMREMGTEHLVYWCPFGLTALRTLSWDDYAKQNPRDVGPALARHKREMPGGTLCVYLPSPWETIRYAVKYHRRELLRQQLHAVLRSFTDADWIGLDATSSWDEEHAWALHEIEAMGFKVLIEGPPAHTHPHLQAFGCYVTGKHLWKLDREHASSFDPAESIGPLIIQHDGTKPDEDAPAWPEWGPTWGAAAIESVERRKRGIQRTHYAIGVNEPRPDLAMGCN